MDIRRIVSRYLNRVINTEENRNRRNTGQRFDPYLAYNFIVEIDSIMVAGFSEVSGLSVETQFERKNFGGENDRDYLFFTYTKHSDITLKHGIGDRDYLWRWYQDVIYGRIKRFNGSICLLDQNGNKKVWWDIIEACPIKWEGPSLNASSSSIAFESIVLNHNGIHMHR